MKIYVDQIPEEGLELNYQEAADFFTHLEEEGKGAGRKPGNPVHVSLVAGKKFGDVIIKGSLQGTASLTCSRCLEELTIDISHDFSYDCRPEKEEKEELLRGDIDICYYTGGEIDITALIQEQVALAIPMKPLCKEDCKGLCPRCGANLNIGDCGCQKSPVDLRFAAIKGLKIKN